MLFLYPLQFQMRQDTIKLNKLQYMDKNINTVMYLKILIKPRRVHCCNASSPHVCIHLCTLFCNLNDSWNWPDRWLGGGNYTSSSQFSSSGREDGDLRLLGCLMICSLRRLVRMIHSTECTIPLNDRKSCFVPSSSQVLSMVQM